MKQPPSEQETPRHRGKKGKKKPFVIETRWTDEAYEWMKKIRLHWKTPLKPNDWRPTYKYATERDRDNALASFQKPGKHRDMSEYRKAK